MDYKKFLNGLAADIKKTRIRNLWHYPILIDRQIRFLESDYEYLGMKALKAYELINQDKGQAQAAMREILSHLNIPFDHLTEIEADPNI